MSCFRKCFKNISVEPCLFFFSISQGLYVIVAQNLYIQKVCQVNLNISAEICENITNHKDEQLEVQKYVSVLQGYNGILQALPAVIYALFAGPWSDIHGRKLLIVCSCFGYVFNNGVFIINTIWFHELKAEYLLFECLQDCTGGYVCFFLACYAYISDISTKEKRTKRLAFLDGLFPAGFFTGMAVSGLIKDNFGFIGNFSLGIAMAMMAMLYAIFILKDSRKNRPKEVQQYIDLLNKMEDTKDKPAKKGKLASLFDLQNVKEGFKSVFRKRDNNLRTFVILLSICFVLEIFLINGKGPTMYLYFRRKFSWNMNKFGSYIALFGGLGIFSSYVVLPFMTEKMKLHDTTIGLLAISGCIAQQVIVCFVPAGAEYEWIIYVSGIISFLSGAITTTCRSLVTKCVGPLEVGKVFSIMGAFQAMVPLAASPTYAFIYKATVEDFPGVFLLFSAGLYLVVMVLLIIVNIGMRRAGVSNRETNADFEPVHMEKLLQMKNEEKKVTKFVLETAPEGDRFKEVAVLKERLN